MNGGRFSILEASQATACVVGIAIVFTVPYVLFHDQRREVSPPTPYEQGQAQPVQPTQQIQSVQTYKDVGEALFHDPILSVNGKVSCSTCHDAAKGYSSGGLAPRLGGGTLSRRAPNILDRGDARVFFWDGRASTLFQQAAMVLTNPDEMGNKTIGQVYARAKAKYPELKSEGDMLDRIVAYERTLRSPENNHDRYLLGVNDNTSLTEEQIRGWELFRGEARCYKCHTGRNFTDDDFHNTGIGAREPGRQAITGNPRDAGRFKTPGLRGCGKSGPWMHDASLKTLEDLVEFYDRGGLRNPNLDPEMKPLNLDRRQKADLVAFLKVL